MANVIPQNPHNNATPVLLNESNYADPYQLATLLAGKTGIPTETLDRIHTDLKDMTMHSLSGFLDMWQMAIPVSTNSVHFTESTTPDYVITKGVTRLAKVFTIDWTLVDNYEANTDSYFFRVDDVIAVYDNAGTKEMGVITAIDKNANTFTAECRNGANWTIATSNITIDVNGSDFDYGSCGPDGLLELRKTTSRVQKLQKLKEAIKTNGNRKYKICIDKDDTRWYPDNLVRVRKALNFKVDKTLLNDIESASGSGAHSIGKYGSLGLFSNMLTNSFVHDGYITNPTEFKSLTAYWDSLGYKDKTFFAFVDPTQYDYFEAIAVARANAMGIVMNVDMKNAKDNFMRFGFTSFTISDYTIQFSKWDITRGNSPFARTRIKAHMPKGIIVPMGTVKTEINGTSRDLPYIFKVYKNEPEMPGMIRQWVTGGYADKPTNDCEYKKLTLSTDVALVTPAPEALVYIK